MLGSRKQLVKAAYTNPKPEQGTPKYFILKGLAHNEIVVMIYGGAYKTKLIICKHKCPSL